MVREQVVLWGETLAAFGTPRFEYPPPPSGGHAGTEAVGTFAVDDARLEGALHGDSLVGLAGTAFNLGGGKLLTVG